ncbi:defensin-like protein 194 [Tribolium madens]|uniref:defensin-like protein 194 n=1 Tax=Tribolium madens TaxID=41895 RepID=UPI001CF73DC5|nr:defensin-like protein 194 [Tribolium madens]
MMKLSSIFAIVFVLFIISTVAVSGEEMEVRRVERGFFCNPALCYRNCKLDGYRRGSCSGDECVCI